MQRWAFGGTAAACKWTWWPASFAQYQTQKGKVCPLSFHSRWIFLSTSASPSFQARSITESTCMSPPNHSNLFSSGCLPFAFFTLSFSVAFPVPWIPPHLVGFTASCLSSRYPLQSLFTRPSQLIVRSSLGRFVCQTDKTTSWLSSRQAERSERNPSTSPIAVDTKRNPSDGERISIETTPRVFETEGCLI